MKGVPLKYPVSIHRIEPWTSRKDLMKDLDNFSDDENAQPPDHAPVEDIDNPSVPDPSVTLNHFSTWDDPQDEFVLDPEEMEEEPVVTDMDITPEPTHRPMTRIAKQLARSKVTQKQLTVRPTKGVRQTTRKSQKGDF